MSEVPTLAKQIAVVTGASRGIGAAIARKLAALGALTVLTAREQKPLQQVADEICTAGGRAECRPCDLAESQQIESFARSVLQAHGRCDILVNNAGVSRLRPLADTDDEMLDWLLEVNFVAAFRLTRALLPALRSSRCASVVNIASELALVGQPGYAAYCGTKGAMLAWSRTLALELAPDGVRVNAVCPGPIDTRLLQEEFAMHRDPHAARAEEIGSIPLARLGLPGDIAPVVAFLASDAAAFVTGAAWCLDGGKTAR